MKLLKYLTLYDKILIIFVIIVSISAIILPFIYRVNMNNEETDAYIMIQSGNEVVKRIAVARTYREEPILIKIRGQLGTSMIEAYKGRVRMKKAPETDPLKICEKTGWISQTGPRIICVPNKITIWIEAGGNDIDGVSW